MSRPFTEALGLLERLGKLADTEPKVAEALSDAGLGEVKRALARKLLKHGASEEPKVGPVLYDCPKCQSLQMLVARAESVDRVECDVRAGVEDVVDLDWETADIEADFGYYCAECGDKVAYDLHEVEELLLAGKCVNGAEDHNEETGNGK